MERISTTTPGNRHESRPLTCRLAYRFGALVGASARMELPGHLGVALLVTAPLAAVAVRRGRSRRAWLGIAGVLALSMAPDVDLYLAGVAHRGVTHTALAAVVAGGSGAVLACLLRPRSTVRRAEAGRFGGAVGGVAVLAHLLGDVLTPMGIRPFLPVSGRTYTLSLVYAADPVANAALLVSGVAVFGVAVSVGRVPLADRVPLGRLRRRVTRRARTPGER